MAEDESRSSARVRIISAGVRSLTIQNFATSILAFIFLAALLRLLPPKEYGIYAAIFLSYTIVSAIASFGLEPAMTRFVAMWKETEETKSVMVAKTILVLSLILSSLASVIFIVLSPYLSLYFTKSTDSTLPFAIGGLWVFGGIMSGAFLGLVQGLRRYGYLAEMIFVSRTVMVVVTIAGLYVSHNLMIPVLGWILYYLMIALLSLKIAGKKLWTIKGKYEFSIVLRYSIPLALAGIVNVIANTTDQLVVGGFLNSVSLGIYTAAVTISSVLGVVLFSPLNAAFLPEVASRIHSPSEILNGLRLAFRYVILTMLPASFIVSSLSNQLLTLFSGNSVYQYSAFSLQILAFLFIFSALQGIAVSLLQAVGSTRAVLIVGTAMVVTGVALSINLVPWIGIEGAALSNALVGVIGFLAALPFIRRYLTSITRNESKFYLKVLIGSCGTLAIITGFNIFVSTKTLTVIPYSIIGGLFFLALLKLLKGLNEEDRQYLANLIPFSLRRFLKYL